MKFRYLPASDGKSPRLSLSGNGRETLFTRLFRKSGGQRRQRYANMFSFLPRSPENKRSANMSTSWIALVSPANLRLRNKKLAKVYAARTIQRQKHGSVLAIPAYPVSSSYILLGG